MATRVNHQEIVKAVLEAKAVDFEAIGRVAAKLGPSLAFADDPWEVFCGTMRIFIRIFVINPQFGAASQLNAVADLSQLREVAAELRR